jgi:hypothetical protein
VTMTEPAAGTRRRARRIHRHRAGTRLAQRARRHRPGCRRRARALAPEGPPPDRPPLLRAAVTADDHEVWLIAGTWADTLLHDHGSSAANGRRRVQDLQGIRSFLTSHPARSRPIVRAGLRAQPGQRRARAGHEHPRLHAPADDHDVLRRSAGRGRPHPLPPGAVARAGGAPVTADELYEHFLIDCELDACMATSRIRLALSTVQLFVTRCLMNLERDVAAAIPVPRRARVAARPPRRLSTRRALGPEQEVVLMCSEGYPPRSRPTCCSTSWARPTSPTCAVASRRGRRPDCPGSATPSRLPVQ